MILLSGKKGYIAMDYLAGFGNHHQSEALEGTLPKHQNSPQLCSEALYAEQLSGTAFTRPRHQNFHSWLYRILPSVVHGEFTPLKESPQRPFCTPQAPNPMRWSPMPSLQAKRDFIDGLFHLSGNALLNVYLYQFNESMQSRYLSNFDGECLFVPYKGTLCLHTEFGPLSLSPGQIAVIPRGVYFRVTLETKEAAGYLCDNQAAPLTLPNLGPIGANSLANPRHFLYPKAAFEEINGEITLVCKSQNTWWQARSDHSPLNVVAWHGNYAPYCYDLSLFNTVNTVSFDHPDPSIFTVLTSESAIPGIANLDFVIFPPRWMVAEHTFRPPYFHRNVMNELMGLIKGEYDAKKKGFTKGGVSIHNCMTAHGPDATSYQQAIQQTLTPEYYHDTLAFMFESCLPWQITESAMESQSRQRQYANCWQTLKPGLGNKS